MQLFIDYAYIVSLVLCYLILTGFDISTLCTLSTSSTHILMPMNRVQFRALKVGRSIKPIYELFFLIMIYVEMKKYGLDGLTVLYLDQIYLASYFDFYLAIKTEVLRLYTLY